MTRSPRSSEQISLGDVDLRLLRVFMTIVQCNGFSAAHASLGMTQATISTHMRHLEERLRVLMCERKPETGYGKWTWPGGFMEMGATTDEGAARETDEEAGAQFEMQGLFSLVNVVHVGQVHLFYRARLLSDQFKPGIETIEARLFTEEEIPWYELAIRTEKETLKHYFADRRNGHYVIHTVAIV